MQKKVLGLNGKFGKKKFGYNRQTLERKKTSRPFSKPCSSSSFDENVTREILETLLLPYYKHPTSTKL
jgi:hypothetical protein